jgi:cytochrome c6
MQSAGAGARAYSLDKFTQAANPDRRRRTAIHLPTMKQPTRIFVTSCLFILGAALGCAAPAADNWDNHCTKCHGPDGKGQTKTGKKLSIRDYTDAKVQAELKDAEMAKAIADGVKVNGKEKMKAYSGELSPAEVTDLVAYIRKFKS